MKTNSSLVGSVMMAGMFFFVALSAHAGHDSDLLCKARALDVSSDQLLTQYRKELREGHGRPSRDESRLLQEISNLETLADRVRSAIENRESLSCVTSWMQKLRSAYNCTRSLADHVGVCRCTRGMVSTFGSQLYAAERSLSSTRPHDDHRFGSSRRDDFRGPVKEALSRFARR